MKITHTEKLLWIDIQKPGQKEVEFLGDRFNFHPLIYQELIKPSYRPKIEEFPQNVLFLILHFPIFNPQTKRTIPQEVDFIICESTLITAHNAHFPPLEEIHQELTSQKLRDRHVGDNPGQMLYYFLEKLYDFSRRELDHITHDINSVEHQIFTSLSPKLIHQLSLLLTNTLNFRRTLLPQQAVIDALPRKMKKFFGPTLVPYLNQLKESYYRVWRQVENLHQTITALKQTSDSLMAHRTNEIIKTLAMITFLAMPFVIMSAAITIKEMSPEYFPLFLGVILVDLLILFIFKWRHWF